MVSKFDFSNDSFGSCLSEPSCGGNGICELRYDVCSCDPFFTTALDFVNQQTCVTNIIAVYVLWSLNLFLLVIVLYTSTWMVLARVHHFVLLRERRRNYTLWQNKTLLGVLSYFLICLPFHFSICIIQLTDPESRIGFDLMPTIFFFFTRVGFNLMDLFSTGPLIAAAFVRQQNGLSVRSIPPRVLYLMSTVSFTTSTLLGLLPFVIFARFPSIDAQFLILQIYLLGQGVACFINIITAVYSLKKLVQVMDSAAKYVNDSKSQDVKVSLKRFVYGKCYVNFLLGISYIIFGLVPILQLSHKYLLPLSWLLLPYVGYTLTNQLNLQKARSWELLVRLGLVKNSSFPLIQKLKQLMVTSSSKRQNRLSPETEGIIPVGGNLPGGSTLDGEGVKQTFIENPNFSVIPKADQEETGNNNTRSTDAKKPTGDEMKQGRIKEMEEEDDGTDHEMDIAWNENKTRRRKLLVYVLVWITFFLAVAVGSATSTFASLRSKKELLDQTKGRLPTLQPTIPPPPGCAPCGTFLPDACVGEITVSTFVRSFRTDAPGVSDQVTMSCGSKQTGLKDFAVAFRVFTNGQYLININVANTSTDDSTLELFQCNNTASLQCNDNKSLTQKGSTIFLVLYKNVDYIAFISKASNSLNELGFNFRIDLTKVI